MEEPGQRHARRLRAITCARPKLLQEAGWSPAGAHRRDRRLRHVLHDHAHGRDFLGAERERPAQRRGRAADGRVPDRLARVREASFCPTCRPAEARHQGERAPGRQRAVRAARDALRLRHHRRQFRAVDVARQRAARLLGLDRRRPGRQPQHHRHQEPGHRQADRARSCSPRIATSWWPRRARSTACCCGTTTSCRSGTIPYERIATWDIFGRPEKLPSQTAASIADLVDRSREAEAQRLPRATNDGDQPSKRQAWVRLVGRTLMVLSRPASSCAAAPAACRAAPWALHLRRPQVPGRLQAFRLRQPGRAEGRARVDDRHRRAHDVRQLQQLHPQGRRRAGPRAICSTP